MANKIETRRLSINLPVWQIDYLDSQAKYLGVTKTAVVSFLIKNSMEQTIVAENLPAMIEEIQGKKIDKNG